MSWIKEISYIDSEGKLRKLYNRVKGPDNNVDNVMSVHSLRPHSMEGHMALYKNVLHHSANSLPKHYLETIGIYVSHLNKCDYCVEHHFAGLTRLLRNTDRSEQIFKAVKAGAFDETFDTKERQGLRYAAKLTMKLDQICKEDIDLLREHGFSDGEILELNQVASYFNYVNRMVVGLGVDTAGDILGLSPNNSDDPESWNHD